MGDSGQTTAAASTPAASQPAQNNGVAMGATAIGGLTSAYAQYSAGQYNKKIGRINAELARTQGSQAEQAGALAANRLEGRERLVEGADAASAAAGNTVVGAGTNRAVIESNRSATAMDRYMIELNARREAYGYRVRATGDEMSADMAGRTGDMGAASTLINTAADEWLESDSSYQGHRGGSLNLG